MAYSKRFADALACVCELHGGQVRKASDIPYVTHLLAVAALTGEYGGGEDEVIAALLHDAAEDQGGHETLTFIRDRFGGRVASYVAECSDTFDTPKPPWRERKQRFIDQLPHVSPGARLIIAADKIHNAESLIRALRLHGEAVWERFRGGKAGTLWFYEQVAEKLRMGWEHPILLELRDVEQRLIRAANS